MSKGAFGVAVFAAASLAGHAGFAQTRTPPSPKDFAMAESQSDQYEILAARVALVEGRDPRVTAFAERMIDEHDRASEALLKAVAASKMLPPQPGMSSDQAALLSSLQGVRGADFDRAYARQQVLAHTQAAAVNESFAMSGADPTLKMSAQAALPMIRDHLRMAQALRDLVGGS